MTTTDKNRFVAEKLGMCWHDIIPNPDKYHIGLGKCIKCGEYFHAIHTSDWNPKLFNPDFSTDNGAVQLLRMMREREDWEDFKFEMASRDIKGQLKSGINNVVNCITTPGALLNAVWEFFGGEE